MKKKYFALVCKFLGGHYLSIILFAALFTFSSLSSVMAHKVRVFAYESGGEIIAEAKFNNGRPAKNSTIVVTNKADGTILLQGSTDNDGSFHFAVPVKAKENRLNLNIILDVGEGHKGSWLLSASDYLGGQIDTAAAPPEPLSPISPHEAKNDMSCTQLEQIIEQVVEKELFPIKKMLAESSEQKLKLQDILGGLGYIFGLAGVAAYFHSKNQGKIND
jgi:nickel transport protein